MALSDSKLCAQVDIQCFKKEFAAHPLQSAASHYKAWTHYSNPTVSIIESKCGLPVAMTVPSSETGR